MSHNRRGKAKPPCTCPILFLHVHRANGPPSLLHLPAGHGEGASMLEDPQVQRAWGQVSTEWEEGLSWRTCVWMWTGLAAPVLPQTSQGLAN